MTSDTNLAFSVNDFVVYPTHGVGRITAIEEQEIAGFPLRVYVIEFIDEKMTLRIPINKANDAKLRKISSDSKMTHVFETLKGKAQSKKSVMWSRRAQEYETKINSGDPISIAEVVRDLHCHPEIAEQSYSERQMYKSALERLAREFAAVEQIDTDEAVYKLEEIIRKAA